MTVTVDRQGESVVAIIESSDVVVASTQDALDLMATIRYDHDTSKLILPKAALSEEFFNLRSGLAGDILQKYTNYRARIAIVGDFTGYDSRALRDFIRESNAGTQTLFLPTTAEALERLHRRAAPAGKREPI